MKRVIDGNAYDTDAADVVAMWSNGRGAPDSRWCAEILYRQKQSGRFFLHGEGGPLSRYSRKDGNTSIGAEAIFPCSRNEAQWWCEKVEQPFALPGGWSQPQGPRRERKSRTNELERTQRKGS